MWGKMCHLGNFEHDMIADAKCVSSSSCGIFKSSDFSLPIMVR